MSTAVKTTVEIDHRSGHALVAVAEIPVVGTLAFVPGGNLLVFERAFAQGCVIVHEYAPGGGGGWAEVRAVTLKGLRGSPVGCAASPDGTKVAAGLKTARVYGWPGGGAVASMPPVKYQIERNSLGFSPDGALLAVGDGGYVSPRQRTVQVCDAATGDRRAAIKTGEWDFVRVSMPDATTVVTLGLALDWEYGDPSTQGQRVLGCYDVATGKARWRRVLRAGQFAGVDRDAALVWVADDAAPHLTANLLGLAASDGRPAREVAFGGDWRACGAAPAVLGPATLALDVESSRQRLGRTVVLDVIAGRQVALLGRPGGGNVGDYPMVAHPEMRRVAATGEGRTLVWQLP